MEKLIKAINNIRPNKEKVSREQQYCYGYVDALNKVIEVVKEMEEIDDFLKSSEINK